MKNEPLLALVTKLKACPAHDRSITREMFLECWNEIKNEDVTPFNKPTVTVMAALVMGSDMFAALLDEAERMQMQSLVNFAIDRYDQKTNPPNKLGKIIAGIIKKDSI
jgi:hypothetical protein